MSLVRFNPSAVIRNLRRTRHLADAAIDGLNAGYANTGFIGFPLAIVFLGHEALAPTLIATILTVSVLFGIGIIIIETGLQGEVKRRIIFARVAKSLMKNAYWFQQWSLCLHFLLICTSLVYNECQMGKCG
ncbi:hypothetical protein OW738_25535 [Klebsiella pneumoniae]|uniref:hypothetical protein n=1 Tax=Klebsiella pneumoniae complex TaxID=3390273 RepID=UPI000765FBC5|nr:MULTISPECIES: hypothetical protein [Klebsiella]MCE0161658.1 hypothetical protein [Klebsiella variicola subsp. variicola]HBR1414061.1 hypothetical protein [Klebsiella pneumoniae]HBR1477729.1 hypothetical protein [Klebsiella pneumoniae]HCT5784558.1 hypothetical protein [Klebsiella variicola]HDZ1694926.1 hypothetical protein [Klebsiella pneumoniae]